jgi:hypothetical protein
MGKILIPHAWVIGQRQNNRPLCVGEGPGVKALCPGIEGGAQCLGCTDRHQGLRFANVKRHSVHYIIFQQSNNGRRFSLAKIFKIRRPELRKGKEGSFPCNVWRVFLHNALCMGRRICSLEWGLITTYKGYLPLHEKNEECFTAMEELAQKLQEPCCM